MGRTVNPAVSDESLLKREDCKRTKHDSAFSQWKILIEPSNWEDYLLKKEGAERYRTQNLPNSSSCPGLYELGIAVSLQKTEGKSSSRLGSKSIIPVYLGQADNVRTRLQQYGRDGAHLENGWSNGEQDDHKVLGLFSGIFSLGFAIAFRWAPMNSKKDAEKTESQLLKTFDYAWNRGMNGERRPSDIHQKLNATTSNAKRVPLVFKKLHVLQPKKVGLNIKRCDSNVLENGSNFYTKQKGTNFLTRIFKFSRTRPTLVSKECDTSNNDGNTCGVALGHGSICTKPPVDGRKRCADHKGMKVNAIVKLKPCSLMNTENTLCGVTLDDGSFCTKMAVLGRKRCEEHKGMRINRRVLPISSSRLDLGMGTFCKRQVSCEEHKGMMMVGGFESEVLGRDGGADSLSCAAVTLNGSVCRRKPGKESNFCWQHEAMRSKD
uniref:HRT transcription factor n=1 Tax=Silybum marianum TaxID=92921 RepID=A0A8K1RJ75_SILMA|nr:HRT transcription factor [Silybum marianum]